MHVLISSVPIVLYVKYPVIPCMQLQNIKQTWTNHPMLYREKSWTGLQILDSSCPSARVSILIICELMNTFKTLWFFVCDIEAKNKPSYVVLLVKFSWLVSLCLFALMFICLYICILIHLYNSMPMHQYTCTAVHHYSCTPVLLYAITPVCYYTSTPLHPYISMPVHLYTSVKMVENHWIMTGY